MWKNRVVRKKLLRAIVQKHIRAFPTPPMQEPALPLPWKNDSKVLKQPLAKQLFCTALCRAAPLALCRAAPWVLEGSAGLPEQPVSSGVGRALLQLPARPWRSRPSWTGCIWQRCWPRSGLGQQPQAAGTEHHYQHHPDTPSHHSYWIRHRQNKVAKNTLVCSITSKFCLD